MIAAIYARKSTDDSERNEDARSTTRQIEHAREFAAKRGWTVADDHIYADEAISGAEWKHRTQFNRLISVVEPVPPLDPAELERDVKARVVDVIEVFGRQTVQARQMLRKILADKIEFEPVGSGRGRSYRFRGALTLEKLISGEAFALLASNTPDCGGPNGPRRL